MPTVFEHIADAAGTVNLDGAINGQLTGLGGIGQGVAQMSGGVNSQINALANTFRGTQLPDLNLENIFVSLLSDLRQSIPSDISQITGAVTSGLGQLSQSTGTGIVQHLTPLIETYRCLVGIIELLSNQTPAASAVSRSSSAGVSRRAARSAATPLGDLAEGLQRYGDLLDSFTPAMTAERLAAFFAGIENGKIRRSIPSAYLPILDEFSRIFATLSKWKALSSQEIGTELSDTLQSVALFMDRRVEGVIGPIEQDLTALGQANLGTFGAAAAQLRQSFENLSQAVGAQDAAQVEARLTAAETAIASFHQFKSAFETHYFSGQTTRLRERLQRCPADLDSEMLFILNTLNPPPVEYAVSELLSRADTPAFLEQVGEFSALLEQLFDKINDLAASLNLAAVSGVISDGSNAVRDVLTSLDEGLTDVTSQVSFLLEEALEPIEQFDPTTIVQPFEDALQSVRNTIVQQVAQFFNTLNNALTQILQTLSDAVESFDPAQLKQSLTEFTAQLGEVLSNPDIVSKLEQIKSAMNDAVGQLGKVSFKPVADLVIGQIEEISQTLQKLTSGSANAATKTAISAAVAVLPGDAVVLDLKGNLLVKMDDLANAGPIALLRTTAEQPARLMTAINQYSPLRLVGNQLSQPYNAVLQQLEQAKPSVLIRPLEAELDKLKDQLSDTFSAVRLLAPVERSFDDLMVQFDRLSPENLIAPLQQALSSVIGQILDAAPLGELNTLINTVSGKLQEIAAMPAAVLHLLEKVNSFLQEIQAMPTRLEAWFADIYQKIEAIPPSVNLSGSLQQIREAVGRLQADEIKNRLLPPVKNVSNAITGLDLPEISTQLLRIHRDFPLQAAEALPEPLRTRVIDFHKVNHPLENGINELFNRLRQTAAAFDTSCETIDDFLGDWDQRFHGANSPLVQCFPPGFDLAEAKSLLRTTIENELQRPLSALTQQTGHFLQYVEALETEYNTFLTRFSEVLPGLLDAPTALSELTAALNDLVDHIRNFNLGFITAALGGTFADVKGKLNNLHPARFRQILDQTTQQILDSISFDALLPQGTFQTLDQQLEALVQKLRELDPAALVGEVLQPEFERLIQPYLEIFDLSELLESLLAQLDKLKADLDIELNRVIEAYQQMRGSVPSVALSADIDIGF